MGFEAFTAINCYDFLNSNNRLICKHCKMLKVKDLRVVVTAMQGRDRKQNIEHRYCIAQKYHIITRTESLRY